MPYLPKNLGSTGWCWEVWNEPDIARFFKGSSRQYLELYVKTAEGVKAADPTAKVGGAADASLRSPSNPTAWRLATYSSPNGI